MVSSSVADYNRSTGHVPLRNTTGEDLAETILDGSFDQAWTELT